MVSPGRLFVLLLCLHRASGFVVIPSHALEKANLRQLCETKTANAFKITFSLRQKKTQKAIVAVAAPLLGAVQRIAGSTALLTGIAIGAHAFITGPLPAIPLVNTAMAVMETLSFASAGFIAGLIWAVQFLIIDTGAIERAVQHTWGALVPDNSAVGKSLDTSIRSFVKDLRSLPGFQGFIIRTIFDFSGVFNEPGLVGLVEEVERTGGGDGGKGTALSSLVTAAAQGAVRGRLDELKTVAVAAAVGLSFVWDGGLLLIDWWLRPS